MTTIEGTAGDDTLYGGTNADTIEGLSGDDFIIGDDGNDQIQADDGNDVVYGGLGDDVIYGGNGDDTIYPGWHDGETPVTGDFTDGGNGNDFIRIVGGAKNTVLGGADDDYIIAESGILDASGGDGNDIIFAADENDTLYGGDGDDIIVGYGGDDQIDGGRGNDKLIGGAGTNILTGGEGTDGFYIGFWGKTTITDFDPATEVIRLNYSTKFADLRITADGGNTVIENKSGASETFNGGTLTLLGVTPDALSRSNFEEFSVNLLNEPQFGVKTLAQSGDILIDGLIDHVSNDLGDASRQAEIIYTFDTSADQYWTYWFYADPPNIRLEAFSRGEQANVRYAFSLIDTFSNVNARETTSGEIGNLTFAWTGRDQGGVAWYEGSSDAAIWFLNWSPDPNTFLTTLLHEIGHFMGLKHPHEEYEVDGVLHPALPAEYDGDDYTIMSYNVSARHGTDVYKSDLEPRTFMWLDIQALQHLYGVDTVTTAGNETYDFSLSERYYQTLWDYAGTDSLSVSGDLATPVHLNLTPGTWSNVGTTITYSSSNQVHYDPETGEQEFTEKYTLFITPDTIIENARGGKGDDTLTGNDANNVLVGMDGDDLIMGGGGNDSLWAGGDDTGNDLFFGGLGDDIMGAGKGDDILAGDGGRDTLFGGAGDDVVIGGSFNDRNSDGRFQRGDAKVSNTASNSLWGGGGNDTIIGTNGSEIIGGGEGDDFINAWGGDDIIYAGKGSSSGQAVNDTINGGDGNDVVFASDGNDSVLGGDGDDDLFGGTGEDTVHGGDGDDTLWGGGGDDLFTGGDGADVFAFGATSGKDTVTDFSEAEDELRLTSTVTDFTDTASVAAAATEATVAGQSGLLIDTGGGNSVFLVGLALEDLSNMIMLLD